jgi:CBS domain containing-hemolysin-like protein
LLGIGVCAGASFYFALAESALFSLGKWRSQQLAEQAKELGREVMDLLQEPQDLLATILLGNTLANAGVVAIALWAAFSEHRNLGLAVLAALGVILIGGEVIPKTLAVRAPEVWSLRLVRSVVLLKKLTRPLRQVAQQASSAMLRAFVPKSWKSETTLTDEEYQELLEMAYQQGTLARAERDLILQIVRLDRRTAKEVMKPRARMACIPDDLPIEEMLLAAKKYKHRRLPMYDETPDTVVGILNTRAFLLAPDQDLADAVEFPSFVPESMNLLQLFRSFQRQRRGLGIVLDEFGGTAGLVTTEDILEEVVGEIRGEGETEGFTFERLAEGRWRVNGTLRLEDFQQECPELAGVPTVDTIGGLVVSQLGIVPTQGESVSFRGVRLTAAAVDERRVKEVLVESVRKRGRT